MTDIGFLTSTLKQFVSLKKYMIHKKFHIARVYGSSTRLIRVLTPKHNQTLEYVTSLAPTSRFTRYTPAESEFTVLIFSQSLLTTNIETIRIILLFNM